MLKKGNLANNSCEKINNLLGLSILPKGGFDYDFEKYSPEFR